MHLSAQKYGDLFFKQYINESQNELLVVDIGSLDVNGSLRQFAPKSCTYKGLDFAQGKGVDIVLTDPYQLPVESDSVDVIVCSSVFEHSDFFWLLFLECLRILKPSGVMYVNVPSNGMIHRYPVDSWRFYPDSPKSLVRWGQRNGYSCELLESFIAAKEGDIFEEGMWNDNIFVILRDGQHSNLYPKRILDRQEEISSETINLGESDQFALTQDQKLIKGFKTECAKLQEHINQLQDQLTHKDELLMQREKTIVSQQLTILEFLESTSWKITKPLRRIVELLRSNHKTKN